MGTFMGHFLPGIFFIIFALWWSYSILVRYFKSRQSRPFVNQPTYPCQFMCCRRDTSNFPMEGLFKIIFCSIGLAGEIYTGMDSHGNFVHLGNGQHATMFSFFGVSGVVDFLMHYKCFLPPRSDYVFSVLCFTVEGLLFMFHTHGREPLDVSVHQLLVYVIWCCVAGLFAEMKWKDKVLAGLTRTFFVMLQGTWFIQVGFILYPPFSGMKKWDLQDHMQIMVVTIIFAWHMFFIFCYLALMSLIIGRCTGKQNLNFNSEDKEGFQRLLKMENGPDELDSDENETVLANFAKPNGGKGGNDFSNAKLTLQDS